MRYALLVIGLTSALCSAGCKGGGGSGLFSALSDFFGGGSSNSIDILSSLPGGGDSGEGGTQFVDLPSGGDDVPGVATLYNPEPASFMLFGGGLAAAAWSRRRRSRRRSA